MLGSITDSLTNSQIFKDVQHRHDPDYKPKNPDLPFKNKPSALDPRYAEELARVSRTCVCLCPASSLISLQRGMTVLNVPIKAIGVWDTVGEWQPLQSPRHS